MADRKADDTKVPSSTGSTRIWIGDAGTQSSKEGSKVPAGAHWERPANNWLNRPQPANGRHAAITTTLHNWSSYKSWADRMRNSWDKGGK